jgi:lipopolysaccharide transport system permease protein
MIASPIMWSPSMMPNRLGIALLDLNPVARLIELVREPLLGNYPSSESWIFGIVCALLGWIVAAAVYASVRKQVAFWI